MQGSNKNYEMHRRQFLKLLRSACGVGAANLPWFSLTQLFSSDLIAAASEPHMVLHIRANGGWDVLMAMNAKDIGTDPNYRESYDSSIRRSGTSRVLQNPGRRPVRAFQKGALGRSMSPLFSQLNDVAIINGIKMLEDSSAHETNRQYMSTGATEGNLAFFPFLVARTRAAARDRVAFEVNSDLLDGGYGRKVPLSGLSRLNGNVDSYDSALFSAQSRSGRMGSQKELMQERLSELATLARLSNIVQSLGANTNSNENQRSLNLAVAGFASGYLQSAICEYRGDFDTHSNHDSRQGQALQTCFQTISNLINTMKSTPYRGPGATGKSSVFDLTTVVVTSDFSRSAAAEQSDGTGHNQFDNSCVLFGKNIVGGQVIGQSDIYQTKVGRLTDGSVLLHSNLFDFKAQRPLQKSEMLARIADGSARKQIGRCQPSGCLDYIYPETIWRTIGASMGLGPLPGIDTGPILKQLVRST